MDSLTTSLPGLNELQIFVIHDPLWGAEAVVPGERYQSTLKLFLLTLLTVILMTLIFLFEGEMQTRYRGTTIQQLETSRYRCLERSKRL